MLKKQFSFLAIISALIISLVFVPIGSASAQADGTYNNVRYEVKQSGSNNTSIADGYFSKPATVTVNGNTATVQITLTGADMIKSLSVNGAPVTVVSDSGKTRVVKFNVSGDLYSRIPMKMHIVVPDMYDTTHTADLLITDLGSSSSGSSSTATSTSTSLGNGDKNADNPKTSDNSPIVLYSLLLVGAAGALVLVRKLRPTSN